MGKRGLSVIEGGKAPDAAPTAKGRPYARTFEKRRREILAAAWDMIARTNGSDFTLQELSERCGASLRTIYNAFGDKEGVVAAAAAAHHHTTFDGIALHENDSWSLAEAIQATRRVAEEAARFPGWSAATVEMYFSPRSRSKLTESLQQMPISILKAWLRSDEVDTRLVKQFGHHALEKSYADLQWGVVADWCAGRIDRQDMARRMAGNLLAIAAAFGNRSGRSQAKRMMAQ